MTALEESLEKKIRVLDEIYRISRLQTEILDKKPMDFERFDAYVDDKDICIEKLNKLDEGFAGAWTKQQQSMAAAAQGQLQILISEWHRNLLSSA